MCILSKIKARPGQTFRPWVLCALLVFGCLLFGCSVRKKSVDTQLEATGTVDIGIQKHNTSLLVTKFYGDVLSGTFNPDTSSSDSTTFESVGLRITLKSKGKKIDFKAEAKPVARSELTTKDSSKTEVRANENIDLYQQIKQTVKPPQWPIWVILIIIIGALLIIRWAYQKFI